MVSYSPPIVDAILGARTYQWDLGYERRRRNLSASSWQDTFAAIQADSDFADGDTIALPPGTYPITASIPITRTCTIKGHGRAIIDTSAMIHMMDIGTTPGVRVENIEFDGPGNATYNTANTAIRAIGASAANRSVRFTVDGCTFRNMAFECIQATFFERVGVYRCTFENSYVRAGLMNRSNKHVSFNYNHVHPPTSGTGNPGNNCYPVSFSRDSTIGIVEQPTTDYWECVANHFYGNPWWSIIDTHGGRYGLIECNILRGGGPLGPGALALVSSADTGGLSTYAPKFIIARSNVINSELTDGTASPGIVIDGAGPDVAGTVVDLAEGIDCSGNLIIGHGKENTSTSGGMVTSYTAACKFHNIFQDCSPHGMVINHDNYECNHGIISRGHWSNSLTNPSAVNVNSFYNTGILGEIIRSTGGKVATNVNSRGIQISSSQVPATHNSALVLGPNKISGSNAINSAVALRPGGMLKQSFANLESGRGIGADGTAGNFVQTFATASLTLPAVPTSDDVAAFLNALVDNLQAKGMIE